MARMFSAKHDGPSWKFRRRLFFIVVLVSFFGVFSILLGMYDAPNDIQSTGLWGFFAMIGTVLGAYTAGATWEDIKLFPTQQTTYRPPERNEHVREDDFVV